MSATQARVLFEKRGRVIGVFILLFAVLLVMRLYFLQIVHGDEYRDAATNQYIHVSGGYYNRGSIFFVDKDGREVSAATLRSGYTVAFNPKQIQDVDRAVSVVEQVSSLTRDALYARARKSDDPYEEVAKRIDADQVSDIIAADVPGVDVISQRWRYYPGNTLAAHTIGFVAYDENELRGVYGLERYYEDVLARADSGKDANFFAELFANVRDIVFVPANKRTGDVITTIDPSVQLQLEAILRDAQKKWNSAFTAGIVMDPQTGEIRAMAIAPAFDLNNFAKAKNTSFANLLVERVYEMGSIVKALTVAAGLDSGVITATSTYNDTGTRVLDGATIANYDQKARGVVSIQEILSQSLNIGAAHVALSMGADLFRRYMYNFGINEETGIDLPNEAQNLVANLMSPRQIEYATASFGQGIALTPISMARALAVLPDGYIEQPHIVKKIRSQNGLSYTLSYDDVRERVLSEATVKEITRMLVKVYDEALLNGSVKMDHYSIAAKTGTAQIASPDGGYYDDRYLHTFFGYFPAYDAKYLVLLMNAEPKGAQYASQTLTEPFVEMTHFLINYYNIPPDR